MEIVEGGYELLNRYGQIPIAFEVRSRLVVSALPGLVEEPVVPWKKDYDSLEGEGPESWRHRFGECASVVILASRDGEDVGGAFALASPEDPETAILFDLRVLPSARRSGVATALYDTVCRWAAAQGCRRLEVETQDINVAACRFYRSVGLALTKADAHAYPMDEVQLIWTATLG
ncbi:MAG TPA: GNAT family N-acetyltransferase [Fimbriimonas sp.]